MAFTDKQMRDASQVAYCGLIKDKMAELKEKGDTNHYTVEELIEMSIPYYDLLKSMYATSKGVDPESVSLKEMLPYLSEDVLTEGNKGLIEALDDETLSWKVVDAHDTTDKNGFFACTMETEPGKAIVGIKGSKFDNPIYDLYQDWIKSDFGLINSVRTDQQEETENYIDRMVSEGILDNYNDVGVTGYSLGGNLAAHFTVASAKEGREEVFNKITQCASLDGPGFSNEYLVANEEYIKQAAGKVDQYSWSAIGNVLNQLPGSHQKYCLAANPMEFDPQTIALAKTFSRGLLQGDKLDQFIDGALSHKIDAISFNEDGSLVEGNETDFMKQMKETSKQLDQSPKFKAQTIRLYYQMKKFDTLFSLGQDGKPAFREEVLQKDENGQNVLRDDIKEKLDLYNQQMKEEMIALGLSISGIDHVEEGPEASQTLSEDNKKGSMFTEILKMAAKGDDVRTDKINEFIGLLANEREAQNKRAANEKEDDSQVL